MRRLHLRNCCLMALVLAGLVTAASAQETRRKKPSQGGLGAKIEQLRRSLFGASPTEGPQYRTPASGGRPTPTATREVPSSPRMAVRPPAAESRSTLPRTGTPVSDAGPHDSGSQTSAPLPQSSRRTAQPGYHSRSGSQLGAAPSNGTSLSAEASSGANSTTGKSPSMVVPQYDLRADSALPTLEDAVSKPSSANSTTSSPEPLRTARRPERLESSSSTPSIGTAGSSESPAETTGPAAPRFNQNLLLAPKTPVLSVQTVGPRRVVVGQEATYKLVLKNNGEGAADNVAIQVQLPTFAELVKADATQGRAHLPSLNDPGTPLRWTLATLEPGSRQELELRIVPHKREAFQLGVEWTYAPNSAQATVEVQEPKLAMKLSGPKEVAFGEKAVYKLIFSNPGDADTRNVQVRLLPIGTDDGPLDTHMMGTLRAGETKEVEMELVARQSGTLAIKAEATAEGGLRAMVNEEVLVRRAGLNVAVLAPKFQYARTAATYTIQVTNPGNDTAHDVQVTAHLPTRAEYVSCSGGGQATNSDTRVTWTIATLEPGDEQTFDVRCRLESTGTNRLQVASTSGDLRHSATGTTTVEALADLTLEVRKPVGAYRVGEKVTYEVTIRNRGTEAAKEIDVLTFFSAGIEAISASGARNEIGPGRVVFQTIPSLGPDKEIVLSIVAAASASGNHTFRAEVYCNTLGTKLGQEGTVRFFGGERPAAASASSQPTPVEASTPAGEPTPLGTSSDDLFAPEPKPAGRYGEGS